LLIDLNCGCPVPKIVRTGSGSALLKNPALIRDIVAAMGKASGLPITVKLRLGWDGNSINYRVVLPHTATFIPASPCPSCIWLYCRL